MRGARQGSSLQPQVQRAAEAFCVPAGVLSHALLLLWERLFVSNYPAPGRQSSLICPGSLAPVESLELRLKRPLCSSGTDVN